MDAVICSYILYVVSMGLVYGRCKLAIFLEMLEPDRTC